MLSLYTVQNLLTGNCVHWLAFEFWAKTTISKPIRTWCWRNRRNRSDGMWSVDAALHCSICRPI